MGCCDKNKPADVQGEDDNFRGPVDINRSCTDVPMLLVFIAFFGGVIAVGYFGVTMGDPYRILYGIDSWGNTCNRKNSKIENASHSGQDMTGYKYRFYFEPTAVLNPTSDAKVVCTKACPNETLTNSNELETFHSQYKTSLCRPGVDPSNVDSAPAGTCPNFDIEKSKPVLTYCMPEIIISVGGSMFAKFSDSVDAFINSVGILSAKCENSRGLFQNFVRDLNNTWKEICYCCLISIAVATIFTMIAGFFAAIFIWTSVIVSAVGAIGGTAYCWYLWNKYKVALDSIPLSEQLKSDQRTVNQWFYFSIAATCFAVIILLILLVMRKRIMLVVQLFREAGKAMRKMPLLLFQPLWTLLSLTLFLGSMVAIYTYIATADNPIVKQNDQVVYVPNEVMFYIKWYYLLGILWIVEFIFASQQLIVAGSVAIWYFNRGENLDSPILRATKRLVRFHLGTIAFGSLLVAIVQLCRIVLAYIQKKLNKEASSVTRFLLKCLQCCLWCFEKCIKFLNKNAYIMTAIYGTNFCTSTKNALKIVVSNALRIAAINSVGTFCLFLSKISVAAITAVISFFFFSNKPNLCYLYIPLILTGAFSLAVAHCFLSIYSMAIDTIFICFCVDCERNDGLSKPYFMSKDLMNFVENSRAAMKALEEKQKTEKGTVERLPHTPVDQDGLTPTEIGSPVRSAKVVPAIYVKVS